MGADAPTSTALPSAAGTADPICERSSDERAHEPRPSIQLTPIAMTSGRKSVTRPRRGRVRPTAVNDFMSDPLGAHGDPCMILLQPVQRVVKHTAFQIDRDALLEQIADPIGRTHHPRGF